MKFVLLSSIKIWDFEERVSGALRYKSNQPTLVFISPFFHPHGTPSLFDYLQFTFLRMLLVINDNLYSSSC